MVAAIASRLPAQLAQAELKKVVMKPDPDSDAFQLWLKSRKEFERMTEESNQAARRRLLAAEDDEGGLAAYQKALALNPGDAALLADHADALTAVGRPKEAIESAQRAIKLNPLGPSWSHWALAYGALMAGEDDLAIKTLEGLPEQLSEHPPVLASAYARRGVERGGQEGEADVARARELLAAFEKEDPDDSLEVAARQPFRCPKDRQTWVEGLRLAGLRPTAEAPPEQNAP